MQTKTKQRWAGLLILLSILSIFLPLVFHNTHPAADTKSIVKIPPKPKINAKENSVALVKPASSVIPDPQMPARKFHHKKQKYKVSELARTLKAPEAWCIQLGTFSNINNANGLVITLRKKGFDAYSRRISNKTGKKLTRVYVGPEIKKANAAQLRNKLEASLHLKGIVQQYKVKT